MRRVVLALCLGLVALLTLTQTVAGRQSENAPVWYRQYPLAAGNPATVTCPTRLVCYAAGTDGLALRTTDSGQTWQRQSVPVPAGFMIRAIACRSETECLASADGQGGSFRTVVVATTDGGRTWHRRRSTASGRTSGLVCPVTGDCFALLGNHFVALRPDGTRWRERDLPLPTTAMYADGLACPDPQTCYIDASENRGDGYGAVLATTDGGLTWRTHIIPPNRTHGSFVGIACPDSHTCYVVSNARSSGVLVTHDAWKTQVFHSIHAAQPPASGPESNFFAQPVCPDDQTCYLRSSFGPIASTTDGGKTWLAHPLERPAPPFYFPYLLPLGVTSMACPAAQGCVAVQTNGNIARTANGGNSWATVYIGTARSLSGVACAGPTTCFAVGPDGTLLATSDGSTWTRRGYPLSDAGGTLLAIACRGSALCLAAGTHGAIARTLDSGATWTRSTVVVRGKDQVLLQAAACPTATSCYVGGYAYTSGGPASGQVVLFRTRNAGATWVSLALPTKTFTINAIACVSARVCMIGSGDASDDDSYPSGSLLLTGDGGVNWRQVGAEAYFGIACPGGNACEVVGQSKDRAPLAIRVTLSGAVAARWEGSGQRYFRDSLNSVACTGLNDCYAVGDAGLVTHTSDGTGWATAALGINQLTAVTCVGIGHCYAVGAESAILSTSNIAAPHSPVPTATPQNTGPSSPTPTPTALPVLPTPTQVPAGAGCPPTCTPGMLLYHAVWSHGLNGWKVRGGGSGGWQVKHGILISPPVTYQRAATFILPPFQPGAHGIANYAIQFQVRPVSRGIGFHLSIRRQGKRYDDFAVSGCCTNSTSYSIIYRDDSVRAGYDTIIGDAHLPPIDTRWHTYRMEAQGEMLRLIVDGRVLIRGLDRHLLAGGEVDLTGQDVPIMIRHFTIVSL